VSDPGWTPLRDTLPVTWADIASRWPGHDVRGAWDAIAAATGSYTPRASGHPLFEPDLFTDGIEVFFALPDPRDEWQTPPYWAHVPGTDSFRHPIPMTRRLHASLLGMMG
jgi:hypothetical protein